jgi:hypothetical protein
MRSQAHPQLRIKDVIMCWQVWLTAPLKALINIQSWWDDECHKDSQVFRQKMSQLLLCPIINPTRIAYRQNPCLHCEKPVCNFLRITIINNKRCIGSSDKVILTSENSKPMKAERRAEY